MKAATICMQLHISLAEVDEVDLLLQDYVQGKIVSALESISDFADQG